MTVPAVISLKSVHDYIYYCSDDLNSANNVTHDITLYAKSLVDYPFIGTIVDHKKVKGKNIRRITYNKKYNIYYRVDEQAQIIYILKIVNGKRSIDRQLFGL